MLDGPDGNAGIFINLCDVETRPTVTVIVCQREGKSPSLVWALNVTWFSCCDFRSWLTSIKTISAKEKYSSGNYKILAYAKESSEVK
jgi:hypothetical protein